MTDITPMKPFLASKLTVDHRSDIEILEQVQLAKDHAARVVSEALIMSYRLHKAIDLRWQFINEIRQISNGMHRLATPEHCKEKPQPWPGRSNEQADAQ